MEVESSKPSTRETWSSRTAFLLVAVGAAVGFGNVFRFPSLVYSYGGGVFFIPYILALIFVGIPLLIQEVAMGQHYRVGDVGVSNAIHKSLRGIGIASIACGFMVAVYYVPLIAWCFHALIESFGHMHDDWEDISGSEATSYFFNDMIGVHTLQEGMRPTRIVPENVFYLALTWVIVGLCLSFGIQTTGRIAYFTMGLPVIMLIIILIRALTLPGASNGVGIYFGNWDLAVLINEPDIWSTAVSQIFFSVGVTFGVMTAFGSHCEKNAPAVENSLVIALANSAFSVVSGLVVFALLGYLSTVEMDFRVDAGPAFIFGAYPAAYSTIPGGIWWVRFLFFNLILLGLDSAFALVEGVVSVIEDSSFNVWPKRVIVAVVCICGFGFGLIYCTDAGLIFLDTIDFYVNFVILFLGFCKSFAAGWIYGIGEQVRLLGFEIVYAYIASTFGSLFFASLIWFGIGGNTVIIGFVSLVVVYGCGAYYCWTKMKGRVSVIDGRTMETMKETLLMSNVVALKDELSSSVGHIPYVWAIVMKHFIPQILLVLFFNLGLTRTDAGNFQFGDYNDYKDWPFQVLGILCVLLVIGIVVASLAKKDIFAGFVDTDTSDESTVSSDIVIVENDYKNMRSVDDHPVIVEPNDYKNMDTTEEICTSKNEPQQIFMGHIPSKTEPEGQEESDRSSDDGFVKL